MQPVTKITFNRTSMELKQEKVVTSGNHFFDF